MKELREIKSRYEFSLDSRQAVLIVSGLILVLMLSFLMGTLFGRNLSKMSGQEVAAQTAEEPVEVAQTPARTTSPDPIDTEDVSRESDRREALIRQLNDMKVPTEVDEPKEIEPVYKPAMTMARMDEDPVEEPKAEPAPKPAPKPAIEKPVVPAGSYTIQLASLPGKDDAEALVAELRSKKYDVYMVHINLPAKGSFYRVRMGHYRDMDQAQKALKILQAREGKYFDAWVTQ